MKHTPGPWSCDGESPNVYAWRFEESCWVARAQDHVPEHIANSLLIAAAPELLKAAAAALKALVLLDRDRDFGITREVLEAAIAKATGAEVPA